jgi:hypothetical protein
MGTTFYPTMKTGQVLLVALTFAVASHQAVAQGPRSRIPGQLNDAGGLTSGIYDLRFAIYGSA